MVSCPAFFIAAPASGQGKTTATAALARYFQQQGKKVKVFKTGPDYLDPQVLAQASGASVEPLDLWMAGEDYCIEKLHQAAQSFDLIIIEGAMGIFDGEPSSADLASRFGLPIVLLLDVKGMAQTAAAVAQGIVNFRSDLNFLGIIANDCGSQRHQELIQAALPDSLSLLLCLPRDPELALPQRHLGLVQASEVSIELEHRFNQGAAAIERAGGFALPAAVSFSAPRQTSPPLEKTLTGHTIGIARDAAFSFIYQDNVDLLKRLGAEIRYFSPLHDKALPAADGYWLPGGYPELYSAQLAANQAVKLALLEQFQAGKPILAECGGFLYCLDELIDLDGVSHAMAGLLSGCGAMRGKRGCQGMQYAPLPEGELRAHAHHRSRADVTMEPIAYGRRQRHSAAGEAIYRSGSLTATYLHLFFPSNPTAIAQLFAGNDLR